MASFNTTTDSDEVFDKYDALRDLDETQGTLKVYSVKQYFEEDSSAIIYERTELDYYVCTSDSSELDDVSDEIVTKYSSSVNYYCLNETDSIDLVGSADNGVKEYIVIEAAFCDETAL